MERFFRLLRANSVESVPPGDRSEHSSNRLFYLLFFIAHTLLLLVYLDAALNYGAYSTRKLYKVLPNTNVISRALPLQSLVTHGSFDITEHRTMTMDKANIQGRYFSDKAPLPMLIVVPFYATLNYFGALGSFGFFERLSIGIGIGGFLAGVIPFVIAMTLCLRELIENQILGLRKAVLLSTLPFYGSYLFVFSGGYFNHLLAASLMLIALCSLRSRYFMAAGTFASLACMSEYSIAFLCLCWALVLWRREMKIEPLLKFTAGAVPAAIAILCYNASTTGDPFVFLYKYSEMPATRSATYGFGFPTWQSLWGLTLGPKVGLFLYVPALLPIGLVVLRKLHVRWSDVGWPQILNELSKSYLVFPMAGYFLLISGYAVWDGGVSFGPRHLTVVAMLCLYAGLPLVVADKLALRLLWWVVGLGMPFFWLARNTLAYATTTNVMESWRILTVDQTPTNMISLFTGIPPLEVGLFWVVWFVIINYLIIELFFPRRLSLKNLKFNN